MKPGVAIGVFALASALSISGQSAGTGGPASGALLSSFENTPTSLLETGGQVYREIDDPHTGDRWLLLRDPSHPGGPGRLVRTQRLEPAQRGSGVAGPTAPSAVGAIAALVSDPEGQLPVIHNGDELIVEKDTKTVEERLEAVALGPAAKGAVFEVRLKIGGKVFRAVALGQGRAAFAPESEALE